MRALRRLGLLAALAVLSASFSAAPAQAAPSPWWHLTTNVRPSTLQPGGEGVVSFRALNLGDASVTPCTRVAPGTGEFNDSSCAEAALPAGSGEFEATPVILTMTLPPGLAVKPVSASEPEPNATLHKFPETNFGTILCTEPAPGEVRCSYPGLLGPLLPYEYVEVQVAVVASGAGGGPSELEVSGGATAPASLSHPISIAAAAPAFGVEAGGFAVRPEEAGGGIDTRAGSHPFQLTTDFALNQNADTNKPPALTRNLAFELPPGLLANATAVARCSEIDFLSRGAGTQFNDRCPSEAAVGVAELSIFQTAGLATAPVQDYPVPVFNLAPGRGEPARFGFYFAGMPVTIDFSLRTDGDYGATATVSNATEVANLLSTSLTIWGTPADPLHDASRGWGCLAAGFYQAFGKPLCLASGEGKPRPFLQLPTSCQTPFAASVEGLSWPNKSFPAGEPLPRAEYSLTDEAGTPLAIGSCAEVPFDPQIAAATDTSAASSPSGLRFGIDFEDEGLENQNGIVESQIKRVVIALPAGFTTNPAAAGGLGACTLAAYEAESLAGQSCPDASKIGSVEIESPLVEPLIRGNLYVAKQGDNVNDNNLLTIYLIAKSPELGVIVKQALKVTPDPQTGQLTSEVDNVPRLPFSHLRLAFRSGLRAPLITPPTCGDYSATADLYPWSQPDVAAHRALTLHVSGGSGGAPCASSESQLPNHPTLEAGTTSSIAGAYAPFVFKVSREDGSQPFSVISATLPEGLLGKLAGVSECSNAEIARAQSLSGEGQGVTELASPSCPASSQVGVVNAGTGAGTQPYYVQGKAYLAGPYKGAPLSLAIITPAVVGPFDLGDVVIRTALYVNETTAQIHAVSDPIPTILHGLPTVIRSVSLNMNRPDFTLNPTSCDPKQITGEAISALGNIAPLAQRFQVGACNALGFAPKLALSLKGSTKRGGVPALKAVLTYPKGNYANIARASVTLPHSEFLKQEHIRTICTRVQFAAGNGHGERCPKGSIYGKAKAWTPLLDKPLEGPVYLRSSSHPLPDLVAALGGQIDIALEGTIDSVDEGIRNRFQAVPDAPVSKFVLEMQGGKKGLLVNSTNLCKGTNRAISEFTGQNGKIYKTNPVLKAKCRKGKKAKRGGGRG